MLYDDDPRRRTTYPAWSFDQPERKDPPPLMSSPTLSTVRLRAHTPVPADAGELHGSFAWSCHHEHEGHSPKNGFLYLMPDSGKVLCGVGVIAGTDKNNHPYIFGLGCAEDVFTNPDMYEDDGLELHGTHELDDDLLAEAGLPDRYSATGVYPNSDIGGEIVELSLNGDDDSAFVVAATTADGELAVLSANLFHDLIKQPHRVEELGYTLWGTHVLPQFVLADLFGEDDSES